MSADQEFLDSLSDRERKLIERAGWWLIRLGEKFERASHRLWLWGKFLLRISRGRVGS